MKQPRITDFDPNAPVAELGSPLDDMPAIAPPHQRYPTNAAPPPPPVATPASPAPRRESPEPSQPTAQGHVSTEPSIHVSTETPIHGSAQPPKHASTDARFHGTTVPSTDSAPPAASTPVFDLSVKAYQKHTFAYTDEELEAIEDLKIQLRRRYDIRTSKNDIVRCALWDLLDDFARHGERSKIIERLSKQRPCEK